MLSPYLRQVSRRTWILFAASESFNLVFAFWFLTALPVNTDSVANPSAFVRNVQVLGVIYGLFLRICAPLLATLIQYAPQRARGAFWNTGVTCGTPSTLPTYASAIPAHRDDIPEFMAVTMSQPETVSTLAFTALGLVMAVVDAWLRRNEFARGDAPSREKAQDADDEERPSASNFCEGKDSLKVSLPDFEG